MCSSRKYPWYSPPPPPHKGLEIDGGGGGGFSKAQKFNYSINVWSLTEVEGGVQRKNTFRGGGMDNFWNHKM